jgi:sugar lactone lactonase YvrE
MGKQSTNNPMRAPSPLVRATLRDSALPRILLALAMALAFAAPSLAQTQTTLTSLILPSGLVFDSAGNLYFAETGSHVIRKFTPAGILTTVAGTGVQGFSGDGGLAATAALDSPQGLAIDSSNNLFIADTNNHRIRRIANGIIATVAGTGAPGFSGDGAAATAATLDRPTALALDSLGNLYVADANNHRIRYVSAVTGLISTFAGNGIQGFSGDNGPARLAAIDSPYGLAIDSANNLYLADTHNSRIRRIDAATAVITTVAGTAVPGFSGDNGLASAANLALPRGLTLDSAGNLTFADTANNRIRRVSAAGAIATIAGNGTQTFAGDGGPATAASLDSPRAVTLSPASLVTLSDTGNRRIRQIDASNIDTLTGASDFSLSATGASSQSIAAGSSVTYSFAVQFQGPVLSNPVHLAVQGIPLGATPTFSPPQLPPAGVTAFTLAILTLKAELHPPPYEPPHGGPQPSLALALFSIVCFSVRSRLLGGRLLQTGRAAALAAVSVLIALAAATVGCGGNNIIALPEATVSNFTITVTGTATTPTGAQLQHSVNVTLQLVQ